MVAPAGTLVARVASEGTTLELWFEPWVERWVAYRRSVTPAGRRKVRHYCGRRPADIRHGLGSGRLSRELYRAAGW